jgi:hypothetical protein
MILASLLTGLDNGPIVPTTIPKVAALMIGAIESIIIIGATVLAMLAETPPVESPVKPAEPAQGNTSPETK